MKTDVEYLTYILSGIVSMPDDLKVERSVDDMGVLLSVSANKSDMGKLIGKEGQTAKSVRSIMNAFAFSQKAKIHVKILEPL